MLSLKENKKFIFSFLVAAFIYSIFAWITFGHKPMYGETEVRGLIDQEPNVLHPEIYQEILSTLPNGQLLDVYKCQDCFLPYSSIGQNTPLKNGFYQSHFQPKFFFEFENRKYPILFADRIGGLTYSFVKVVKETFSLYSALVLYHLLVGILVIFFFGSFVRKAFSLQTAQIAMTLLAASPLHILNNGNFISKKLETLIFWTIACAFYVGRRKFAILLSLFSGFSVIAVKSTVLMNIISVFFIVGWKQFRHRWIVAVCTLSVILVSALGLLAIDHSGVYKEYYRSAEYLKEWKYFQAVLLDSVLMVASPIKFMEYFLGLETWHFPFTTYTPSPEDYAHFQPWVRMEKWSWFLFIPLSFFISPLVFRNFFNFNQRYLKIYFAWAVFTGSIFFAAHKYFTYSMYTIGSAGFVVLVFALVCEDLWKIRNKLWIQFSIFVFIAFYLFQLIQFIDVYRKNGPILTFSYQAYDEIAHDLEEKKITNPIMFFVSEMGNLENYSDQIKPIYVQDKMLTELGDIFKFSQKSHLLLQMKPDWYESHWPKSISKQAIFEEAKKQNIKVIPIQEYTYRNELVYWLISVEHLDQNKFFLQDVKISDEIRSRIFERNALWR